MRSLLPGSTRRPPPTGAADAHAVVVEDACVSIPATRQMVGDDGLIGDPSIHT
jgi:hypothetical protein